jgi:hypothetical protein
MYKLNIAYILTIINAFLVILKDHDFIFRCQVELKKDIKGRVINRKLITYLTPIFRTLLKSSNKDYSSSF